MNPPRDRFPVGTEVRFRFPEQRRWRRGIVNGTVLWSSEGRDQLVPVDAAGLQLSVPGRFCEPVDEQLRNERSGTAEVRRCAGEFPTPWNGGSSQCGLSVEDPDEELCRRCLEDRESVDAEHREYHDAVGTPWWGR